MVIAMINTQDVFRFSTSQPATVKYDVTNLFPFTSIQKDGDARKPTKLGNSSVSPLDNESHMNIDKTKKNTLSIAELLTEVKDHKQVASILDTAPFKNLMDLYWDVHSKLFFLGLVLHIIHMSFFSYYGIDYLTHALSFTVTNETQIGANLKLRSFRAYAIFLVWPFFLFLINFFHLVEFFHNFVKSGFQKTLRSMYDDRKHVFVFLLLEFCGCVHASLTVRWVRHVIHYSIQGSLPTPDAYDTYYLSMAYLFGWAYAISFTRGFKQTHYFSIIIQQILTFDMIRFALIYLFILLGFSFAYGALVQAIPSLKLSTGGFIFAVLNWMTGTSDFRAEGENSENGNVIRIVYSAYVILSTIVLLNLLIAMMNDSYASVRQMSEIRWKIFKLTIPLDFVLNNMLQKFQIRCVMQIFQIRCGMLADLNFDIDTNRWYVSIPKKKLAESKAASNAVIHDLTMKIDDLTMKVDRLTEESRVRESRIQALLQSKDDQSSSKSDEK